MKIVKFVLGTMLVVTFAMAVINFNDNPLDEDDVVAKNAAVTANLSYNTSVRSIQSIIDNPQAENFKANVSIKPAKNVQDWIDTAREAHNTFRAEGYTYQYGGYTHLSDGTYVRLDCSGYISYALYLAGLTTNPTFGTSEADFTSCGFTNVGTGKTTKILPGDLLVYSGHIHMAVSENGTEVYNWGSAHGIETVYGNNSGKDCYKVDPRSVNGRSNDGVTKIWRLTKYKKDKEKKKKESKK